MHWHGGSALDKGDPRETFTFALRGISLVSHCGDGGNYFLVDGGKPALIVKGDSRDPAVHAAVDRLKGLGIVFASELYDWNAVARRQRRLVREREASERKLQKARRGWR
jgi:hypothetical protein